MLYTYNTTSQTVAVDGSVVFQANGVQTGITATHAAGTTAISLNRPGFYMVEFNADAVEGGTVGNITMQLLVNGVALPAAEATAYSADATSIVNLKFTCIVRVAPNCSYMSDNVPTTLTVENTGVEATVSNAAMTVTKLS